MFDWVLNTPEKVIKNVYICMYISIHARNICTHVYMYVHNFYIS